jgi:hypothetical protein
MRVRNQKLFALTTRRRPPHCLYRKKPENKELAINGKKDSHLFGGLHIYP